ncbi:hypothetical protein BGY98DRAFT_950229 [Russula aff. rugulosa BPL654]|nr:hypothetical protein BGY98DRAFT_950229 [Russula aff. rugulosa BPL654]
MKLEYPDDRFDILPCKAPSGTGEQVWQARCLDCPGKMNSFEIHLKNRNHRRRVADRLKSAE